MKQKSHLGFSLGYSLFHSGMLKPSSKNQHSPCPVLLAAMGPKFNKIHTGCQHLHFIPES